MIKYMILYGMNERDRLHWLSSSWCHIPVRLLDYIEEHAEPESHAQINNSRTDLFLFTTTTRSPKKQRTRMQWLVLYCWASPASVELICSAGEPFQRVSGHTHRFVPPLAIPRTDKPHTLLQFTRSSSHRPSVNMGIACSALHKTIVSRVWVCGNAYDKIYA